LPTRYKLIYASLIEFWASGFDELFEGVFDCSFVGEGFLLKKALQMLEKVIVGR